MSTPTAKLEKIRYVVVTPARNEEAFIELTIQSMIKQTHLPVRWVIVSDGSTDRTDEIVQKYLPDHPWMQLVRRPERVERHFAGKVAAFNAGYEQLSGLEFEVMGNLDADITFEPGYFEFLMGKFAENPKLGVGGTPFREGNDQYNYKYVSIEHVSGACQMFRRKCFESIGGYTPIKGGGIDLVAVTTARMRGWETRTFPERHCMHHRTMGTATSSKLGFYLKGGGRDYKLGVHPLWELFRSIYQMTKKPVILGGGALFWGFFWAMITRAEKSVSEELVRFRRKEQMTRLKQQFLRLFGMVPAKTNRPA